MKKQDMTNLRNTGIPKSQDSNSETTRLHLQRAGSMGSGSGSAMVTEAAGTLSRQQARDTTTCARNLWFKKKFLNDTKWTLNKS